MSFPTKYLYENDYIVGPVLDFGCGKGADVRKLKYDGYAASGYDPGHAEWCGEDVLVPNLYPTILCNYVLNVVSSEEQARIIAQVRGLLAEDGLAFFAVRADLPATGKPGRGVFQRNVLLPYDCIFRNGWCRIYATRKVDSDGFSALLPEVEMRKCH